MLRKVMVVEPILCTGCLQCELVCSINKAGIASSVYSRIRVAKDEEKGIFFPVICHHCEIPMCRKVCPVEAIQRDKVTGAVLINYALCLGCGVCVSACPFGAIQFSPEGGVIKCDLCAGDPFCVKFCKMRPEMSSAFMANPRASCLQYVNFSEATKVKRFTQLQKSEGIH